MDQSIKDSPQKETILNLAKDITARKKSICMKDLETHHISLANVRKLFGSLQKLSALVGAATKNRKQNMTDEELKIHIRNLAQKSDDILCPSFQQPGVVCSLKCSCWVTNKLSKTVSNRSKIGYKGKTRLLYQVSYLLYIGPIGKGMLILHLCNNPACFNPEHLTQGTAEDNAKQCVDQGRRASTAGRAQKPRHKLTNPYDKEALFAWVQANITISDKEEWLYFISTSGDGYPRIQIRNRSLILSRLILANKLGVTYESIGLAGHRFPKNLPYSAEAPKKNDVNPDHLYDSTPRENSDDTKEYHEGYHLTREDVKFIFDAAKKTDWLTTAAMEFDLRIAEILGVSAKTINDVRARKTYSDWHDNDAISALTRAVVQLNRQKEFVARYDTVTDAAKAVDRTTTNISSACKGTQKTSGGYIWMYEATYLTFLGTTNL